MASHDRVYTACAMGTTVITNENTALQDMALPGHQVLGTYQAQNPQLSALLESSGTAELAPRSR